MTGSYHLTFEAVDSLMFRDGRPFNQNDEGASTAVSVFPPYPPTLVGAVRAALWHQLGGPGAAWDPDRLGDGTDWQDPGTLPDDTLRFGPPVLLKDGEPVFPVPRHLVSGTAPNGTGQAPTFLSPSLSGRRCDLGDNVALPAAPGGWTAIKNIEDRWLTHAGLQKVLAGRLPDDGDFVAIDDLWRAEPRVGIGLNPSDRAVVRSQLYMASFVRPCPGVTLGLELTGWDEAAPMGLRPLAGEHRMARLTARHTPWSWPAAPNLGGGAYCVVLISPWVPAEPIRPGAAIAGLPGQVVSACLDKPVPIGGWDTQGRRSIPLRQAVPAGSVLFMAADDTAAPAPRGAIGDGQAWGFGHYLSGTYQGGAPDGT